MAKLLCYTAFL